MQIRWWNDKNRHSTTPLPINKPSKSIFFTLIQSKYWNIWKIISCDTRISLRTAISAVFSKPVTSQIVSQVTCLDVGFEKSAEIAVLGLNSVSPGVDAGI